MGPEMDVINSKEIDDFKEEDLSRAEGGSC
jgi:hypothetical protein